MGKVLEFKRKPDTIANKDLKLNRVRVSLAHYLHSKPDASSILLLIKDCFKHLILTRPFDTMLLQRLTILFNKTREDIDNGLGQTKDSAKTNKRL